MTDLIALAFRAPAGAPASAALDALATLRAEGWAPPGATVRYGAADPVWHGALDAAPSGRALLLFATAPLAAGLAAAAVAVNAADPNLVDARGLRWAGAVLAPGGPKRLPASLPAPALAAAMSSAGAAAHVVEDAGRGTVNRALFGALAARAAGSVGLVLVPLPVETARGCGLAPRTSLNRADVLEAARAALACAASLNAPRAKAHS